MKVEAVDTLQYCAVDCICVHVYYCRECQYKYFILYISAVRTVSAGHRMVAEGWAAFENPCAEAGPGELLQLLRSLKGMTTPPPQPLPTTPVKAEQMEVDPVTPEKSTPPPIHESPVVLKLEGHKYQFKCVNCDVPPTAISHAMNAHIRAVHMKKVFLCSCCNFATYILDSMQHHEKGHK